MVTHFKDVLCPDLLETEALDTVRREHKIFIKLLSSKLPDEKITFSELEFTIPLIAKIHILAMTIMVTNSQAERAFSKLKIVKSKLRSTSKQERLNDMCATGMNRDIALELEIESILNSFVAAGDRRLEF